MSKLQGAVIDRPYSPPCEEGNAVLMTANNDIFVASVTL